jgi:hypothetical protein
MCYDAPNRNGFIRYGWFSRGEINSECSWISVNQARKELGAELVDQEISDSLQFTSKDVSQLKIVDGNDINVIWEHFEGKVIALADIVNYVPVFIACMYKGFEEILKDNIQYMEVFM